MNWKAHLSTLASAAIGLATIGGIIAIAYLFLSAIIDKITGLDSDLAKAIIAASGTLLVAVLSILGGRYLEARAKIRQEIREKKIPVYEAQMATFFQAMFHSKTGSKKPSDKELMMAFVGFTEKLLIWGSEDVIKAWDAFRSTKWREANQAEMFLVLENFIKAIRKDIGNKSDSLPPGMLLRLFVTDPPDLTATKIQQVDGGQAATRSESEKK